MEGGSKFVNGYFQTSREVFVGGIKFWPGQAVRPAAARYGPESAVEVTPRGAPGLGEQAVSKSLGNSWLTEPSGNFYRI